jgi:rod shape-determining protein MreD
MNSLHTLSLAIAAFLVVFLEAWISWPRTWLGAQVDLLPGLMVYASLNSNVATMALTAIVGGLGYDALSANPFGVSVLPLFLSGFLIHQSRSLIMRDQDYAQFMLGLGASAGTPLLTLLLLISLGENPLLGWGSLWQWIVMAAGGAAFTPVWFRLFGLVHRAFDYQPLLNPSFRSDREIKRGR